MAGALRFEERGRFRLTPDELWAFVADTDRLNALVGLPQMHYATSPLATGGAQITAAYRLGPLPLARWTEYPWEWRAPHHYAVERAYTWGPLAHFYGGVELHAVEGGAATDLRIFAEITPAWGPLGAFAVRLLVGPTGTRRAMEECRRYERRFLASGQAAHPHPRRRHRSPRLRRLCDRLAADGVDPAIVRRLGQHLAHGTDEAIRKMRPFALADDWGFDRRTVLVAFLRAARLGLVTMSWDVLCPNCRVAKASSTSLRGLGADAHCDVCNIAFAPRFDRLVEVRFTAAASLRKRGASCYCVGGPMNTPHVVAQARVPAGANADFVGPDPGLYRLRGAAGGPSVVEVTPRGNTRASFVWSSAGIAPTVAEVAPGATLSVRNDGSEETRLVLEGAVWPDAAASAAYVSTLAEFRDLFASEVLAPGVALSLESLTFLFTDLCGSTTLYERIGQARAFRLVHEHFALLDAAVRAHHGTVVKTVGDAVMPVFPTPADAVSAALAMQEAVASLDTDGAADPTRLLRVGVHTGPALAVGSEERLDYFGTTVNTAARVEHACGGGQIAMTQAVAEDHEVDGLLATLHVPCASRSAVLRGVTEPVRLLVLG